MRSYNLSIFDMNKLLADPDHTAPNLNDYRGGFSADALDVFRNFKFDKAVAELDDKNPLFLVVREFAKVDLSPENVPDAETGDVYEELPRRFPEMSNETAGEHFSPRDGLKLAVDLVTAEAKDDLCTPGRIVTCCDPWEPAARSPCSRTACAGTTPGPTCGGDEGDKRYDLLSP